MGNDANIPRTREEYLELVRTVERHNELYYDEDRPEITDAEYDALTRALKYAEKAHPEWVSPSSPTQHVGGVPAAPFEKVRHVRPLLSLLDVFGFDEVEAWHEGLGGPETVVEEKIDGLTIALTYRDLVLVQGATRGDGITGELVTEQAKRVGGIPSRLDPPESIRSRIPEHNLLVVRAEVHQPVHAFERCNARQDAIGAPRFANPRNCAAGGLRSKDPEVTAERGLIATAFQIVYSEGWDRVRLPRTQKSDVEVLKLLGFIPVKQFLCPTRQDIFDAINLIGDRRKDLSYWTDGTVVKTNDLDLQERIGATAKYPLHSIAYKYPAETKRTVIRRIVVQTGRTGVLTPVAEFDPVELGGTTVTHATLHNQKFMTDRMLNTGAEIEVLKSGEIIPKVVGVPKPAAAPYRIDRCPVCGTPAVFERNEDAGTEIAMCPNMTGCPAQKLRYFEFFCSRDVMDIRDMGPAVLAAMMDAGLLENVQNIYALRDRRDEMLGIERMGARKADKILANIEKSKRNPVDRVLKGLGIPGVGRHVGKAVMRKYGTLDDMFAAARDELCSLDGVGTVTADAILDFWKDPEMRARYCALKAAGVNVESPAAAPGGGALAGKTFVITGTLPGMSREEAKKLIEDNGGKVSGSVSRKTAYLLAGDAAGGKLAKAKDLGVEVISEDGLMAMLR